MQDTITCEGITYHYQDQVVPSDQHPFWLKIYRLEHTVEIGDVVQGTAPMQSVHVQHVIVQDVKEVIIVAHFNHPGFQLEFLEALRETAQELTSVKSCTLL